MKRLKKLEEVFGEYDSARDLYKDFTNPSENQLSVRKNVAGLLEMKKAKYAEWAKLPLNGDYLLKDSTPTQQVQNILKEIVNDGKNRAVAYSRKNLDGIIDRVYNENPDDLLGAIFKMKTHKGGTTEYSEIANEIQKVRKISSCYGEDGKNPNINAMQKYIFEGVDTTSVSYRILTSVMAGSDQTTVSIFNTVFSSSQAVLIKKLSKGKSLDKDKLKNYINENITLTEKCKARASSLGYAGEASDYQDEINDYVMNLSETLYKAYDSADKKDRIDTIEK